MGPIEHAMFRVQSSARRSLSPWVQRSLSQMTRQKAIVSATRVQMHTSRLLQRVQRRQEPAVMLESHLGGVKPEMVQRFSSQIGDRFTPLLTRHQPAPAAPLQRDSALEMPLAEGASMADTVDAASPVLPGTPESYLGQMADSQPPMPPSPTPVRPPVTQASEPSIQRTPESDTRTSRVQQLREALAANMPGRYGQAVTPATRRPAAIQRTPANTQRISEQVTPSMPEENAGWERPTLVSPIPHPSAARVRRVARVEEVDPFALAAQNSLREEQSASEIPQPDTTPRATPPERTTIQRRVNKDTPEIVTPREPRPAAQQDLPTMEMPQVGPNGESSILQRIRQARAAQLQRQLANPIPPEKFESASPETEMTPPTAPSAPLNPTIAPKREQSIPTEPVVPPTHIEAVTPGAVIKPTLQRHIAENENPVASEPAVESEPPSVAQPEAQVHEPPATLAPGAAPSMPAEPGGETSAVTSISTPDHIQRTPAEQPVAPTQPVKSQDTTEAPLTQPAITEEQAEKVAPVYAPAQPEVIQRSVAAFSIESSGQPAETDAATPEAQPPQPEPAPEPPVPVQPLVAETQQIQRRVDASAPGPEAPEVSAPAHANPGKRSRERTSSSC